MDKIDIHVNVDTLPSVICECGSLEFQPRLQLRKITALQSPTGTEGVAMFQLGYRCVFCKKEFDLGGNLIEAKEVVQPVETVIQ